MGRSERGAKASLTVFSLALLVALICVVRNPFGLFFVGALALFCGLVAFKAPAWLSQAVLLFFGCQLALSVFSRGDYLFTDVANTAQGPMPSDVAQMANALFLPYWFWGALCGLLSLAVLAAGLRAAFPSSDSADRLEGRLGKRSAP